MIICILYLLAAINAAVLVYETVSWRWTIVAAVLWPLMALFFIGEAISSVVFKEGEDSE